MAPTFKILSAAAIITLAAACAKHDNHQSNFQKRQVLTPGGRDEKDWAYPESYDWGSINSNYSLCQMGTQQAPIPLALDQGLSQRHRPDFVGFPSNVTGNFYNWGYGPAYTIAHEDGRFNTLPSMTFDNKTVYLRGWHIHAPADHTVGGVRSRAELHYVMVDSAGHEAAVLALRLDPGQTPSPFFSELPKPLLGFNETDQIMNQTLNPRLPLEAVDFFSEFWTYQGSLTSPPCTEGIRWFLARTILFISHEQMQALLLVSQFSARAEQQVWLHQINA